MSEKIRIFEGADDRPWIPQHDLDPPRQLAYAERDEVRAAYNFAEHLPERRKMMQAWADYWNLWPLAPM